MRVSPCRGVNCLCGFCGKDDEGFCGRGGFRFSADQGVTLGIHPERHDGRGDIESSLSCICLPSGCRMVEVDAFHKGPLKPARGSSYHCN